MADSACANRHWSREPECLCSIRVQLVTLMCAAFACSLSAQTQSPAAPVATAHIGKGYELVQDDRYAEAAKEFQEALALDPGAVTARYQLAVCIVCYG